MICSKGKARLSLTEADVKEAIQLFVKERSYAECEKVESIQIHRKGSKYAVSATLLKRGLV